MTELQVTCRTCNGDGRIYKWLHCYGIRPPWSEPEEYGCPECRSTGLVEWSDYYETTEEARDALEG